MAWKGFITESKAYMGYGRSITKTRFWIRYVFSVAPRFYWASFRDNLREKFNK